MCKDNYINDCKGCKISQGIDKDSQKWGGIIKLYGGWILNHRKGGEKEEFLGWMTLQPDNHRERWTDLNPKEADTLGSNLQRIEGGLRQYWSINFKEDLIERVYVVYFSEFSEHLHIHIIPRPESIKRLDVFENGWKICLVNKHPKFPKKYKISPEEEGLDKVSNLMKYLRRCLSEST